MRRNDDDEVSFWMDDAGGRGNALGSNEAGAVLHGRHQHTLHVRWPRRHRVSAHFDVSVGSGPGLHLDRSQELLCFPSSSLCREIMHAMWKPQKFKYIYLLATVYVFTLTLPSAAAVYWTFGDQLLTHSNAFALLPKSGWRDAAVILMLIHQFITFGFACTPLYFVWEKVIGMHDTKSICLRALVRLPVVIPIWFLAIIFPFFGPINSAVGALLVSFTVYIIPAMAHMLTYRTPSARQNAAEKPPSFLPSWTAMYAVNAFVVGWVLVVGFGLGGWASMTNFVRQVDTFGLFAKCYQCPKPLPPAAPAPQTLQQQHHH
ncbi:hypothetical protein C4D60_Mb09t03420 [Musa balbisiana]|uniref:Amino acid transporter transmembrane domain-containing protein n=1 Tax=Musa balbisiana TaxID=52838 RepID=A0A4S8IDR4_MUSBA|nr:hypothetical protein C4D60_Mb09t03420 [Musa balbisiana]